MKKILFVISLVVLFVSGCATLDPKEVKQNDNPLIGDTTQNSLDYVGSYQTRMMCEDTVACDYLDAQLQLNQYGQYRYREQPVKAGQMVGNPVVFQGKYHWDGNSPVIQLRNTRNMHFFVAENSVYLLSRPLKSFSEISNEPKFEKIVR